MSDSFVNSDRQILELLRDSGSLNVATLAELTGVTATAVRQRLTRLMLQGLIDRIDERQERGRPQHQYSLTAEGRRYAGQNFADLATVLWEEISSIENVELRRKLIENIAHRLATKYAGDIHGQTPEEKLNDIAGLFGQRRIPATVESQAGELPVLHVRACPYPDLASEDSAICEMEESLISELVGQDMKLQSCTQDGACSCRFEPTGSPPSLERS